ncbi:hypothetical protein A9P82_05060 [Arachidicoccus ginsenosidimutans]|uniref:hypothetical protein n=1 Tax=Arachidicoccus sp. BS20 TaxID=1850526 RepID=UPI0007F0AF49|nr:hypothetical protein [Arachidicoccus sp. BS20]ANI88710.1 hypothetical protein A9P82_05060 [Arachidicoccus sp. BS20]
MVRRIELIHWFIKTRTKARIISVFNNLNRILIECRDIETDLGNKSLYKYHIEATESLIYKLKQVSKKEGKKEIAKYSQSENRGYGWSCLPNENGKKAECTYWKLSELFGYYKR